ncbi:MAG: TRAP transporter small permease [Pseudomonadota bacterium]
MAIIAGAAGLIIADVIGRNLGLFSIRATSALVEYALLAATMCGAPILVRRGGHVAVDSLIGALPPIARDLVRRAGFVLAAVVSGFLASRAAALSLEAAARGVTDIRSIDVPGWVATALLAGGLGLCAIEFARLTLQRALPPTGGQAG